MMTDSLPEVFYRMASDRISLRHWAGAGAVVYDDADSSLRVLSDMAGQMLVHLRQRAFNSPELAALLLQEAPQADDIAMVEHLLSDLVALGLVDCEPA